MARTYTTKGGDMVDLIAYRAYRYRPGSVEAVFEANPGLCEHPPILPAGIVITLPDLPARAAAYSPIRLWD